MVCYDNFFCGITQKLSSKDQNQGENSSGGGDKNLSSDLLTGDETASFQSGDGQVEVKVTKHPFYFFIAC